MATATETQLTYDERCFACSRKLKDGEIPKRVITSDGSVQYVGPECAKKVEKAGQGGYQPPKGGPRIYWTWK